jgi:hypothetical protein
MKKYSFAAKIRANKSGSEPKHPEDDSSAMQMHGVLSKMVALQILPRENSLDRLRTISSLGIFRLRRHLRSDFAQIRDGESFAAHKAFDAASKRFRAYSDWFLWCKKS